MLLACSVFQMDLAIHNLNFEFFIMIFALLSGTLNLFLYCYFGKCASKYYEEYADYLFDSNWINLPINMQKAYVIMIANDQQPLYYHGCNVVNLTLETFSRVC